MSLGCSVLYQYQLATNRLGPTAPYMVRYLGSVAWYQVPWYCSNTDSCTISEGSGGTPGRALWWFGCRPYVGPDNKVGRMDVCVCVFMSFLSFAVEANFGPNPNLFVHNCPHPLLVG